MRTAQREITAITDVTSVQRAFGGDTASFEIDVQL